jgi:hypothetical protein
MAWQCRQLISRRSSQASPNTLIIDLYIQSILSKVLQSDVDVVLVLLLLVEDDQILGILGLTLAAALAVGLRLAFSVDLPHLEVREDQILQLLRLLPRRLVLLHRKAQRIHHVDLVLRSLLALLPPPLRHFHPSLGHLQRVLLLVGVAVVPAHRRLAPPLLVGEGEDLGEAGRRPLQVEVCLGGKQGRPRGHDYLPDTSTARH